MRRRTPRHMRLMHCHRPYRNTAHRSGAGAGSDALQSAPAGGHTLRECRDVTLPGIAGNAIELLLLIDPGDATEVGVKVHAW